MDGSALEHSDSDSGESWTLLDSSPAYADDAPQFPENLPRQERNATENADKDEDTDGISIISDSDPESLTPCDLSYEKCLEEEAHPTEVQTNYVSDNQLPSNNNDDHESVRSTDDFLGDSNAKLKTYVHRRNKRLSTVLNIIVLGSVITAAGVAIGHMWGARNECSMHTTPSVNKILSNLYKLQEENTYLRNKLKELTVLNNIQMQHRKLESDKIPFKQHRCKKVFEESLNNKNADKLTKCVDQEINDEQLLTHLQSYEKDFLGDIDKLKNVYQQNKSWLDEEIARRMNREERSYKKMKNHLKSAKFIKLSGEHKSFKGDGLKRKLESINELPVYEETIINVTEPLVQPVAKKLEDGDFKKTLERRITYADSLKSDHLIKKREINDENTIKKINDHIRKKKPQKDFDTISQNAASDDEINKDDRYNAHKVKTERKKNDRRKIHKKQKRRNKYEQWEMNGGYLKDYDDFSVTSENEYNIVQKPDKNFMSRDVERTNYINQLSDTDDNTKIKALEGVDRQPKADLRSKREKGARSNKDDLGWYEKRAALRTEARKKLEQELFGESTPNNAGWYFRRMQRREQCRVKGDNSTYKKLSKRIMNFKTKH